MSEAAEKMALSSVKPARQIRPPRILLLGTEKIGKALGVDTLIATPDGFTTMREVSVGDFVIDKNGEPTRVVAVTPVMHERECYEVEFKGGEVIVADGEHQWEVIHIDRSVEEVRTTEYLSKRIAPPLKDRYNYSVPLCKAVEFGHSELPVDPYTLGIWLGDGTSSSGGITVADRDASILERIPYDCGVPHSKGSCTTRTVLGLVTDLRSLGVLNDKHIPDLYLFASVEQRMAVFAGLMDSDGSCSNQNRCCEFTSVKEKLADGFVMLANSIGIKCRVAVGRAMLNGVDCGEKYRVNFFPRFCPFLVEFKADRFNAHRELARVEKKAIVRIDRVDSVPVKCIEVASKTHTYLAGKAFTVTHNSTFGCDTDSPVVIPIVREEGIDDFDVPAFPTAESFGDVRQALINLTHKHDFKTVVIDSVSTLHPLVMAKAMEQENVQSESKLGGGFGHQYDTALALWSDLMRAFDYLRDIGMASILIGHVTAKNFNDPVNGSYTRYDLDLPQKVREAIYRWVDVILFADWAVYTSEEDAGFNKTTKLGIGDGTRKLFTQKRPSHPGGGRGVYGRLPYELPLDWKQFTKSVSEALEKEKNNHGES